MKQRSRSMPPRKCRLVDCDEWCEYITTKSGIKRQLAYCCREHAEIRRKNQQRQYYQVITRTPKPHTLELLSRETGARINWPGDQVVEPDYWVARELAKINIDDRPTLSRCTTCGCRIREATEARNDGKIYCGDDCYEIRLTETMVHRHPDREPSMFARLMRGPTIKKETNLRCWIGDKP
jgi:hypothetical protein